MKIEEINLSGSNKSGVRPDFMYANMLDQMRYIYALKYVRDKRVLDFACGVGWGSYLMALAGASKVVAVDLSLEAITTAEKYYSEPKVQYICNNLEKVEIPEESIDIITCFETFEHLENPRAIMDIFHRIISADGILLLSTPNGYATKYLPQDRPANPFHYNEYYRDEFEKIVADQWEIVEYRGQFIMKSDSRAIFKYRKFVRDYFIGLKLARNFGIFGRFIKLVLRKLGILSLNEPAFKDKCEPVVVLGGCEPAYHYYILKPKILK